MTSTTIRDIPLDEARKAFEALRLEHLIVEEDCWYSCPLALREDGSSACCNDEPKRCNCRADTHNAIIDYLLGLLE